MDDFALLQIVNMRSKIGAGRECGPCVVAHKGENRLYGCNYFEPVPGKPMPLVENGKGLPLRCPACLEEWPPKGEGS